eukprot:sb/3472593/
MWNKRFVMRVTGSFRGLANRKREIQPIPTIHGNYLEAPLLCIESKNDLGTSRPSSLLSIYIYTASANITPAPRDHLHGEICTVLLRERADIEVAGYNAPRHTVCQIYTHSPSFFLFNYPLIMFCRLPFPRIPISLSRISLFTPLFFSLLKVSKRVSLVCKSPW